MSLSHDATPHGETGFAIASIEEFDLTSWQDADIATLINRIFKADMGGHSFAQNRHHRRYVIYDGEILAAHLAVCFRVIRLGDETVNAIGIAEVVVDRPYRRRGMASALLEQALIDGKNSLADFALLFGTENIYQKAGFRTAPNTLVVTQLHGATTGEITRKSDGAFKVLPLSSKAWDDEAIVDLAGFAF